MEEHLIAWHRIQRGKEYLEALDRALAKDWMELYQEYVQGLYGLAQSLTLVHPDHYKGVDPRSSVRGPRNFEKEPALRAIKCNAKLIWNYECKRIAQGNVVADHLFPWSLGGPTTGANKLYLCSLHNEMKGNDIHLFPWECGEPTWLCSTIEKIRRVIQSGRV